MKRTAAAVERIGTPRVVHGLVCLAILAAMYFVGLSRSNLF